MYKSSPQKPPQKAPRRSIFFLFGIFISLLALLGITAVTAFQFRYADRIFLGVQVMGVDLSELTEAQAAARLEETLSPFPSPPVLLRDGDQVWTLTASELGVRVDGRATAQRAFAAGRDKNPLAALQEQWDLLQHGALITPTLRYEQTQATYQLNRVARVIDRPVRDANVRLQGLEVITTPAQTGRKMNLEATWAAVQTHVQHGETGVVEAIVDEVQPTVSNSDVKVAARVAEQRLKTPFTLTYAGDASLNEPAAEFAIDQTQLAAWLRFQPKSIQNGSSTISMTLEADVAAVREHIAKLATTFAREARDARLDFDPESSQITVLSPSQVGRSLPISETVTRTVNALLAGETSVELPVAEIKPAVDMRDIEKMGIKELVATGSSSFKGSSAARVANIKQGVAQFVGVVIPPDGEFSFNKIVGDISAANGYQDSLVIWGDRTAVGVGGGICQVSSTIFRAAFWGGMPILERWAHGYVVSWYGEPGLDATIYTPNVDFRFRNDTGAYLLVKPILDLSEGRLTFNLYGTKPNRTVEKIGPEVSNVRKPEPPLYQPDPSLAAGQKKQVEWAVDGRDVVVTRVIKNGETVVHKDTFVSKYQPWRAIYLVGPDQQTGS